METEISSSWAHSRQKIRNWKRVCIFSRRDRPRKAGGGYGNVGNAKDMQHQ